MAHLHDLQYGRNLIVPAGSTQPTTAFMGQDDAERQDAGIYIVSMRSVVLADAATEATALRRTTCVLTRGYFGATDQTAPVAVTFDVTRQGVTFAVVASKPQINLYNVTMGRNLGPTNADDNVFVMAVPLRDWTDKRFAPPKLTLGKLDFPADNGTPFGVPVGARELIVYQDPSGPLGEMAIQFFADLACTVPCGSWGRNYATSGVASIVADVPAIARGVQFLVPPVVGAPTMYAEWTIEV